LNRQIYARDTASLVIVIRFAKYGRADLYDLKQIALCFEYVNGWLQVHRQGSQFAVYSGHNYRYHSPLFPKHVLRRWRVDSSIPFVTNLTLPNAVEILEQLEDHRDEFFDLRLHNPILARPI
jgi:hypothetical protein